MKKIFKNFTDEPISTFLGIVTVVSSIVMTYMKTITIEQAGVFIPIVVGLFFGKDKWIGVKK